MEVKNLVNLENQNLNAFIDSIDNFVFNVDGIIWDVQSKVLDGIMTTLEKLQERKKNIYFVSNNSYAGYKNLYENLREIIPNLSQINLITPAIAIISYLKKINFEEKLFIVGSEQMKDDFVESGFTLASQPDVINEDIYTWMKATDDISGIGAAIFDIDLNTNYYKMLKFLKCINNNNVLYITGNPEKKFVVEDVLFYGPGSLQDTLSKMTNRIPMGFGKPNDEMQNYLKQKVHGSNLSRTLFVGDTLDSDILFGKKCGFKTLLVLTGVTKLEDLKECSVDKTPDYYIPTFGALSNYI